MGRTANVLLAAALLTACGTSSDVTDDASTGSAAATSATPSTSPPAATTTQAPRSTSPPAPATNSRGNLPKDIGEVGGFTSDGRPGNLDILSFTVDSIELDRACTSRQAVRPENGQFVFVTMTLTGGDKLEAPGVSLNPNGFYIVDTRTGTREPESITAATYGCVESAERLPDQVTRNVTVTGLVILDTAVPSGSGAVVWSPFGSGTGFEFSY